MTRAALAVVPGLALLFAASAARAEDPPKGRYSKKELEIQGVPQTQLTKPAAPPKESKKESGPTLTIEEFVGARQAKIQKINDASIDKFQRLLAVTENDDPQKPDFHFRIGELYAEKQRYYNFQAHSLDQKIFDAQGSQKAGLERDQKGFLDEEQKWLRKAVEAYVAAAGFKKYEKMDEVLFKLAYLLQTIKREDQAREFFLRLIREYPNSKYVPDAYLSFGQFYFEKGEMDAAKKFYEKVEQFPNSAVYGYAIYKKGWCYINQSDFKTALETFVGVIRLAQAGKASNTPQGNKALEREAKKDVVKAYARTPGAGPDKAWEFFQRVGGDFAQKMMEALAELYWEQGMFVESTKVFHKMMAVNPESPRLCEWQNKVVRNTLSCCSKKDQVQEINRLGIAFDRVKSLNIKKDVLQECRTAVHDITRELALVWHKEAQRTKNPDTYALVRFVYKEYLERFADDKDAVELGFYYGEVLWQTALWKEAAEQYTKVIQMDPNGKYVKEAAYAAVLAWKNYFNLDDAGMGPDKQGRNEKDYSAQAIPEYQKKMIEAFDTYIKYVPDSPELVKIMYRKARIYYEYNQFEKAIPLFEQVVTKYPKNELAVISANLLLDSFNIPGREQPEEVIRWVDRFTKMPDLMSDQEFAKQIWGLKIDSMVVEAKQNEKKKNYKECGRSMWAAADAQPDSPKHAERLYNAGQCFTNARLIGMAVKVRNELIEKHPTDPLAQKALFQIASGYHQLAYYGEAAKNYEQFATKFPGEKEAPTALGNAYRFRVGLGEDANAIDDMHNFIKLYGARKPQEAADVFFQMGEVYEKSNKTDQHIKHLEEYLKQWGSKGSIEKQIFANFKLGEYYWKRSCPQDGVNGACLKIERLAATGRQKAFQDINKKIKDKNKKIKEKGRTQCGPATKSRITIIDRAKNVAKKAQDHFAAALGAYKNGSALQRIPAGPEQQARAALATYSAAGAVFYQGERLYEDFLRVKIPEGLEFQPPNNFDSPKKHQAKKKRMEEDTKKLLGYLKDKGALAEKLAGPPDKKGLYDRVLDYKIAHWTIAASARIGQVWANFEDQLLTMPIPKHLKEMNEWGTPEKDLFCDAFVDKAEPLEVKAIQGYQVCLKAATQEQWFNEWSGMCEVELNQLQPSEYPLAAEARPEAGYVSTLITPASVIPELVTIQTKAGAGGAQ